MSIFAFLFTSSAHLACLPGQLCRNRLAPAATCRLTKYLKASGRGARSSTSADRQEWTLAGQYNKL